jgi:hypothetical protein
MPPTKVTLTGGVFQDSEGNILANGYLEFQLSQDANIAGVGNIAAGITVRVDLGSDGSVKSSPLQKVWGNDQMLPANSYYRVTGYTAAGQPAWGPNNQQVNGDGTTFDIGTWVPNQVISWTPPVSVPLLKTNGVKNSRQDLLNLAGTGVSESGGTVTITSGASISLESDGVPNSSQTVLNLESGDNITVNDNGAGAIGINMRYPSTDENNNNAQSDQVFAVGVPASIPSFEGGSMTNAVWRNPPLPDPQFAQFSIWNQNGGASTSPYFAASAAWQNMDAIGLWSGPTGFTASQTSPDSLMGYARKFLLTSNAGHVQASGNAWINLHRDGQFEANILGEVGVNDYRWYLGLQDAFADASIRDPLALSTAGASSLMFFYNKDVSANIQFATTDGSGGWSIADTGIPFSTSGVTKVRFTWSNTTNLISFYINGAFVNTVSLFGVDTPDGSRNLCMCAAFGGTGHGTGTGIRVGMLYGQNQH